MGFADRPALRRRAPALTLAALVALFLLLNVRGLDRTPPVNEDESWIAAPGVNFMATGHFATPLFAGYFGSERHYYDFMPLYALLDGAVIAVAGRSLAAVRALALTCATLTLLLTYETGRRLLSAWHGVAAVAILGFWPIAATGLRPYLSFAIGIPLADLGHIGRYDVLVPVLGLSALLALLPALDDSSSRWRPFAAGALAGAATLTHYYGVLWLGVVAALAAAWHGRRSARAILSIVAGFALTLAPWAWFVTRDWSAFLAQKQNQATRYGFGAAAPSELTRYDLVFRAASHGQVAAIAWLIAVMCGVAALVWQARRRGGERTLAIALAVITGGLALAVRRRLFDYLATAWPLLALAAAYVLLYRWPRPARSAMRVVAIAVMAVSGASGLVAYRAQNARARAGSSYAAVCDRITRNLPPSARLLALQYWWLGIGPRVAVYRSILVPLTRMGPHDAPPMSFEAAMAVDPMDYVLIDPEMADVLRAAGDPSRPKAGPLAIEIQAFLDHHADKVDAFDDPMYGQFTLYRVRPRL